MSDNAENKLAMACRRLLRPLVRILLRHGVGFRDFAEITKQVYVDVVREDFSAEGGQATDSRVAIVTGLTRKDVKRLREASSKDYQSQSWGGANRATRVLSGWHRDPEFTDAHGAPRALALDDSPQGFAALVKRYSGDMPASAMLAELERVHAIERDENGRLKALNRAFVPDAGDMEGLRMLGSATHDLIASIEYNLARGEDEQAYFQRVVFSEQMPLRNLPVFRRLVAEHGQQFLELLDDWLESHAANGEKIGRKERTRAGVGLYFFQDPPDKS